jgi:hypothetical protein
MLLARGMSGVRKVAYTTRAAAARAGVLIHGNSRAAPAHTQTLTRKIRVSARVRSAHAVQRKGATMEMPGRMAFRVPSWAGENPRSCQ